MSSAALQILWLLHVFALSTQALVKLSLSPPITVECGRGATLHCNTSSSQDGLSIKLMEWAQGSMTLCSVDSEGSVTHHRKSQRGFHCEYENGRLSLVFQRVLPVHSGQQRPYRCKQHSNQGMTHGYTRVELQECGGTAEGVFSSDGPSCTFSHVHPDGDVHWFHDSNLLSDGSAQQNTTKQMDEEGWLTVRSYLHSKGPHGTYNCSLKSTVSGRYMVSTLVSPSRAWGQTTVNSKGVRSQEVMMTVLYICFYLLL